MGYTLKILLKVTHNIIFKKLNADVSDTQFGFHKAVGTRKAMVALIDLSQRCLDMNQNTHACFVDKAFDNVRRD